MRSRLLWIGFFAVTFAYVESAIVVYLREIYYPEGFKFPIMIIADRLAFVEVGREVATMGMLFTAGALAGRGAWERFIFFTMAFGIWDIFYYVWLKVFLNWPPSLLTWDILFLIPVPWIGPVLAPVLVAIAMVLASGRLLFLMSRNVQPKFSPLQWTAAVSGGLLVLTSFMLDYRLVLEGEMPPPFRWWLFGIGLALASAAFVVGSRRLVERLPAAS